MNPSSHSSVHTATDTYSYTSTGACYGATHSNCSYPDSASSLYEDPWSSAAGWSGEYVGFGACSDADRALFEAFLTAEVTSTSPSGPYTLVPMQSPMSYDPEPSFLRHPTEAAQSHAQPLDGSRLYPFTTASSQSTVSPAFEPAFPETTASCISPDLIYPLLRSNYDFEADYSTAPTSQSSRANRRATHRSLSSSPYPPPSPEPSQRRNMPAPTGHSISPAFEQSLPEATMTCISPDLMYPSAYREYVLEDDPSNAATCQPSRASRHVGHRSPLSSPYPSPSPEPSPQTSSIVFASQRRNAPAHTAAPVAGKTWQCPYCPYVQRNRRSPDLKRHIKTHMRGADVADWVCCGVPVVNAIELGVPAATVREAQVFEFDGMMMIGGCRKAFSRRDALIRHLQREKGKCFGDALSLHQRGNRESC